jgi:peptide methionine sulfoxide reductase MsrA
MKNIRSVFILLIGIISLTAFASTSKLDQKPTAALTTDHSVCIEAVNVDYNFQVVSVSIEAAFSEFIFSNFNQKDVQPLLSTITDVGWQCEDVSFVHNPYKEKLIENCNLNFKAIKTSSCNRIRNDC